MAYTKDQLFYKDYKWTARENHDNPKIIGDNDQTELNRTEGYEMLYFINSLVKTWGWSRDPLSSYRHLEKIIRTQVPSEVRTHSAIKDWIASKYQTI
jgi:hypothetical protein